MDWFETLMGFREESYASAKAKMKAEGGRLYSLITGKSYQIGTFELISLDTLRQKTLTTAPFPRKSNVSIVIGDVRKLHRLQDNAGALFQVASQFNMLEMISPDVTPKEGVTRYQLDPTQGPACAIAAGAGTIYRNYFVPVGNSEGQTAERQLDGLAGIGTELSAALGLPVSDLWRMKNGYALATSPQGLKAIGEHLAAASADRLDELRGKLRIGLHLGVQVTDGKDGRGPIISQAYCSALPVAYCSHRSEVWEPFARLVLEAAYEATLRAAVIEARAGNSRTVFLTLLGGGAFGNRNEWIFDAIRWAFSRMVDFGLDVKIVSYAAPSEELTMFSESLAR